MAETGNEFSSRKRKRKNATWQEHKFRVEKTG